MDYEVYSAEDFVLDEFFQQWVKYGNPEAKAFWEVWLLQHPEKASEVEEAKRLLQTLHFTTSELTEEQQKRMYSHIIEGVKSHEAAKKMGRPGASVFPLKNWYWVAAAMTVLLVAGAIIGWYWGVPARQVYYTTAYGEKRTIVLPDQSEVVLNANSTLHFPANWQSQSSREVWLDGEAFFKVQKQTEGGVPVKFTVYSDDLKVEVLGTQFNVSEREEKTHVVLNEGSIRLEVLTQTGTEAILMKPGELVEYQNDSQTVVKRKVNADSYSAWTDNKWVLQDITLQQVADRIEETYGVEVNIPDPRLAREPMTGVLPTESLDKLLQVLSTTYSVRIRHNENELTLTK